MLRRLCPLWCPDVSRGRGFQRKARPEPTDHPLVESFDFATDPLRTLARLAFLEQVRVRVRVLEQVEVSGLEEEVSGLEEGVSGLVRVRGLVRVPVLEGPSFQGT